MTTLLIRMRVTIAPVLLLVETFLPLPAVPGQNGLGVVTEEKALLSSSSPTVPATDEIIAQLLRHNQLRDAQLKHYSVVRTYELRNAKGNLSAQEIVRMDYQAPDKKVFQKISEAGSGFVRHHVFDRLIKSESEAASGKEHHDSALTPANYTFRLVGEEDLGQYHCVVIEAAPKREDKYLFKGRIWVDSQDFATVKIAGRPAKNPSFWIRRAEFVRRYQRVDGFWLSVQDETIVDLRIHGRKLFTVDHFDYSINDFESREAGTSGAVVEGQQVDFGASASTGAKRSDRGKWD